MAWLCWQWRYVAHLYLRSVTPEQNSVSRIISTVGFFPFAVLFWYVIAETVQEICKIVNLKSAMQVETHNKRVSRFRTCVFHPRRLVLVFSILITCIFTLRQFVLLLSVLRFPRMHIWCCLYFHFPYLRNPPSVTIVFRTYIFSPPHNAYRVDRTRLYTAVTVPFCCCWSWIADDVVDVIQLERTWAQNPDIFSRNLFVYSTDMFSLTQILTPPHWQITSLNTVECRIFPILSTKE